MHTPTLNTSGKPFLFIATRTDDAVGDDEYRAMCRYAGLSPQRMQRLRLEQAPMPPINVNDYAGIITGGSPFNYSDPAEKKTQLQHRVEADMSRLLDQVVAKDSPFLGCCFGIGALGTNLGAVVDRTYPEPVGRVPISLTEHGKVDPIFSQLPDLFDAFVGHKESIAKLPASATHLASSPTCPVQAFRVKTNVYATQFHPESDPNGVCLRIDAYDNHGYFAPGEGEAAKANALLADTPDAHKLLHAFAQRYG